LFIRCHDSLSFIIAISDIYRPGYLSPEPIPAEKIAAKQNSEKASRNWKAVPFRRSRRTRIAG
jgi:hypothetical protein